jgi:hypothetical protein
LRAKGLLCENPQVQDAVGRADAMLNAGRVYRSAMIAALRNVVSAGEETTLGQRARCRLAAVYAADNAREAMDLMYRHGGSTSFQRESRLAECWRDLHVVDRQGLGERERWAHRRSSSPRTLGPRWRGRRRVEHLSFGAGLNYYPQAAPIGREQSSRVVGAFFRMARCATAGLAERAARQSLDAVRTYWTKVQLTESGRRRLMCGAPFAGDHFHYPNA